MDELRTTEHGPGVQTECKSCQQCMARARARLGLVAGPTSLVLEPRLLVKMSGSALRKVGVLTRLVQWTK